eukprot:487809-Pelagomonas_calceolata.AAC.1
MRAVGVRKTPDGYRWPGRHCLAASIQQFPDEHVGRQGFLGNPKPPDQVYAIPQRMKMSALKCQRGANSWEWRQLHAGLYAFVKQLIGIVNTGQVFIAKANCELCRSARAGAVCAACTRNAYFTALK